MLNSLWEMFAWKWEVIMRRGDDVMPHRSPHTIEWNQKKTRPSNEFSGHKAVVVYS